MGQQRTALQREPTPLRIQLILRLPQRPGALKEFLNILGPEDDDAKKIITYIESLR